MAGRPVLVDDDPLTLQVVSHTLRHFFPLISIETCMNRASAVLKIHAGSGSRSADETLTAQGTNDLSSVVNVSNGSCAGVKNCDK